MSHQRYAISACSYAIPARIVCCCTETRAAMSGPSIVPTCPRPMSFGLFSFGLFSFGCSRLAGAIDDYDANHSLSPIRQTRVAKTALFVIRPVFQTGAVGLLLRLRNDKSRRYCAGRV